MKTAKIQLKTSLKPYPEYKDSGIDWVGEIPIGWGVASSRRLFNSRKDLVGINVSDYKILSLTLRGVIPRVLDGSGKNPAVYDNYQMIKKDELVFCIFDYDVTPRTIGYVEEDGMLSGAYTRLTPKEETFSKYFYYYFLSLDYTKELLHLCTGLRNSIPKSLFWSMKSALPDLETQKKIAKYLDEKTVLIDQIIEKKKKQIELLREKRTAIINHAMYAHQEGEVVKLKHIARLNPSKKSMVNIVLDDKVSFVPMEALSELGELELQERYYKDVKEGFTYFENGDVVLAKITPCYENGKAGIMSGLKNKYGFGTTEFAVLRSSKRILPGYLYNLVFSDKFRKLGEVEMRGTAGQKRISNNFVKNYEFILPSLEGQRKIIDSLSQKTKLVDSAISIIGQSIETLKEFKSSLISNVVTGKVKV